ncbi:uncharacterized protein LOC124813848 [Hydra vulgaris]|uniref:uncharacterized protein LOC124813848 n=1 Tax=Hydra vulgaris TaxID=6087 RepID=UPI0032EA03EC
MTLANSERTFSKLKIVAISPSTVKPTNLFTDSEQIILNTLASLIAENYSLKSQININKILEFALKESPTDCDLNISIKDATSKVMKLINYDLHDLKNVAASIDELENVINKQLKKIKKTVKTQDIKNKMTIEDEIEECKLVLMFFPNDKNKLTILYKKLANLTGTDDKGIELWLAEAEANLDKIQKIIIDHADLNNVPLMRKDHLEDIKRMLSIEIFKNQYDYFKGKNIDEQVKFINTLALQNSASGRSRISQIYVASMLLTFAVFEKNIEMVKVLLRLKADPRIRDLKYGPSSISYALLKEDFIEEFLKEVIKDKYKLVERKVKCYGAVSNSIRFVEDYENQDEIMDMLRQLYLFDYEDNDDGDDNDDDDDTDDDDDNDHLNDVNSCDNETYS